MKSLSTNKPLSALLSLCDYFQLFFFFLSFTDIPFTWEGLDAVHTIQ